MAKVTIIFGDKTIIKDGITVRFVGEAEATFDSLATSLGDLEAHAIQWDGSSGELEYVDDRANESVSLEKINQYIQAFDSEYVNVTKGAYLAQDAEQIAREIRNNLLAETDWWATVDREITPEQSAYRQALRDLPSTWSPVLVWDDDTWSGNLQGIVWPTKPE